MLHCSVEVSLELFLNFGKLYWSEIYGDTKWAEFCSIYDISTKSPRLKANVSYQNIFGGKRAKKHTLTAQIWSQTIFTNIKWTIHMFYRLAKLVLLKINQTSWLLRFAK